MVVVVGVGCGIGSVTSSWTCSFLSAHWRGMVRKYEVMHMPMWCAVCMCVWRGGGCIHSRIYQTTQHTGIHHPTPTAVDTHSRPPVACRPAAAAERGLAGAAKVRGGNAGVLLGARWVLMWACRGRAASCCISC